MGAREVEEIANEIKALTPAGKLRLAADLLEGKRLRLAHTIASGVVDELGAALLLVDVARTSLSESTNRTEAQGK